MLTICENFAIISNCNKFPKKIFFILKTRKDKHIIFIFIYLYFYVFFIQLKYEPEKTLKKDIFNNFFNINREIIFCDFFSNLQSTKKNTFI
jgi:hypothetical protein